MNLVRAAEQSLVSLTIQSTSASIHTPPYN